MERFSKAVYYGVIWVSLLALVLIGFTISWPVTVVAIYTIFAIRSLGRFEGRSRDRSPHPKA